jgi:hippurate hydrolase
MNKELLKEESKQIQPYIQQIRRYLHQNPETGFDLNNTKSLVKKELEEIGYKVEECGKIGLVTTIGKGNGKTILIRADMDALPLKEEANVSYKSQIEGKMHGCGHDMHTAMLLGAAKLLKKHENEIEGTIKLVFQGAEEIFQGSLDMINNGVLNHVDVAMMIHVVPALPIPSGTVMVLNGGIAMASCEQYHITVKGKGGHGSMPQAAIDPITAASHIHIALQEINSRELDPSEFGVFTTCKLQAGNASNVIPDDAQMWGTIRTWDEKINDQIKTRMSEIVDYVSKAYRCESEIEFYDYCPSMVIDEQLSKDGLDIMTDLLGNQVIDMNMITKGKPGGGSEDFAFVSHKVPTLGFYLTTGNTNDGYIYGQHHPKAVFDDSVLYIGSLTYAYMAIEWLNRNK